MRRQLLNARTPGHLWRWPTFIAAVVLVVGTSTQAQAKISIISGAVFLEEDAGDPPDIVGVGDEAIVGFGLARADDEFDNGGLDIFTDLFIDLLGYAEASDPVIVEPLFLDLDDSDNPGEFLTAEFLFGPGTLETFPSPLGIIGSGSITAEIIDIGINDTGVDLSHFVGGFFQLTYNAVRVTPGTGDMGENGTAEFGAIATGSYTLVAVIPEPTSLLLAVLGFVGLLASARRRQRIA